MAAYEGKFIVRFGAKNSRFPQVDPTPPYFETVILASFMHWHPMRGQAWMTLR